MELKKRIEGKEREMSLLRKVAKKGHPDYIQFKTIVRIVQLNNEIEDLKTLVGMPERAVKMYLDHGVIAS